MAILLDTVLYSTMPGHAKGGLLDASTGQQLNEKLVRLARVLEMEYFDSKNVYTKVPRQEAFARAGKAPISVKWVDTNKGDDENPNYRSRLVAREIRRRGEDSIFAPTPPLEALRTILMLAATPKLWAPDWVTLEGPHRMQLSFIDISRAYFNARTDDKHPTYVDLPPEDPDFGSDLCGRLNVHMYGTRRAADGWHCEYSESMEDIGFGVGQSSACVFRHATMHLVASVHGDDFTTTGPKSSLDWFTAKLKEKYELKESARLGPAEDDDKEARVLNRMVRWTSSGIEYEADPRQGEKLVQELGLEGCKSVATPAVKATAEHCRTDEPLPEGKVTHFRALAARGNYLAVDRPDCQFGAKEICRFMSSPTMLSVEALKRLGRYLSGHPRLVFAYPHQDDVDGVDVYADTDHAGCLRTRKSTSGGCLMVGKHLVKSWSSTQPTITLSSGEAELHGVVRASANGLGYLSLLADLGVHLRLRIWTDSTASQGMCTRQGLGKVRHLDVQELWIQQRIRNGDFDLYKVLGDENPADLFTKAGLTCHRIHALLDLLGCEFRDGRSASAPALRQEGGTKIFNISHNKANRLISNTRSRRRLPTSSGEVYTGNMRCLKSRPGCAVRPRPQPTVSSKSRSKRWADELEEPKAEYTAAEVAAMLREVGLPHQQSPRPPPLVPAAEYPEVAEQADELTSHGFSIAREARGRGGLPGRLRAPGGAAAEEGRRTVQHHR